MYYSRGLINITQLTGQKCTESKYIRVIENWSFLHFSLPLPGLLFLLKKKKTSFTCIFFLGHRVFILLSFVLNAWWINSWKCSTVLVRDHGRMEVSEVQLALDVLLFWRWYFKIFSEVDFQANKMLKNIHVTFLVEVLMLHGHRIIFWVFLFGWCPNSIY